MRKKFFLLSLFSLAVFLGASVSLAVYQQKKFVNHYKLTFAETYLTLRKASFGLSGIYRLNPYSPTVSKDELNKERPEKDKFWQNKLGKENLKKGSIWSNNIYYIKTPSMNEEKSKKNHSSLSYALNHDLTFRRNKPSSLQLTYEEVGEVIINAKEKLITLEGQADLLLTFSPFLAKAFGFVTQKENIQNVANQYQLLPPHSFTATFNPEEGSYHIQHTLKNIHHKVGSFTPPLLPPPALVKKEGANQVENSPKTAKTLKRKIAQEEEKSDPKSPIFSLTIQRLMSEKMAEFPPSTLPLFGDSAAVLTTQSELQDLSLTKKYKGEDLSFVALTNKDKIFRIDLGNFLYTSTGLLVGALNKDSLEKETALTLKNLTFSSQKDQDNLSSYPTYQRITLPTLQSNATYRYTLFPLIADPLIEAKELASNQDNKKKGQKISKKTDEETSRTTTFLTPFLAELTLSHQTEALIMEYKQNKTSLGALRFTKKIKPALSQLVSSKMNVDLHEDEEKDNNLENYGNKDKNNAEFEVKEESVEEALTSRVLAEAKLQKAAQERLDNTIEKMFVEFSNIYSSLFFKKEIKRDLERSVKNVLVPLFSALFLQIEEGEVNITTMATNQKEAHIYLNFTKEYAPLTPLSPLELYSFFTAFTTFELEINLPKAYLLHQGALLAETLKGVDYNESYQGLDESLMVGYLFLSLLLPQDYKFYNAKEQLFWLKLTWRDGELTLNDYPITEQELFEILNI